MAQGLTNMLREVKYPGRSSVTLLFHMGHRTLTDTVLLTGLRTLERSRGLAWSCQCPQPMSFSHGEAGRAMLSPDAARNSCSQRRNRNGQVSISNSQNLGSPGSVLTFVYTGFSRQHLIQKAQASKLSRHCSSEGWVQCTASSLCSILLRLKPHITTHSHS